MINETMAQDYTIRAPRQRVFRALTDASELTTWFPTKAESTPRKGGSFRYDWTFPKETERDHLQQGEYTELVEGERVAYPWQVGPSRTQVEFTLKDSDEGTQLRMAHSGWSDGMEEAYEKHAQGWVFFLGNLKSVLEEGIDRREEMLGMDVGEPRAESASGINR